MKKALITDDVHPLMMEGLARLGYAHDFEPGITLAEVHERIGHYEGLVINSKIVVDKSLIDKAKRLEFVARLGSGMEIVDIPYAEECGIHVISSPEGNRNAVAEHALGMLLAFQNHLLRGDFEVRRQIWQREANRGFELMGRCIGIVGFGHTGSSFARKLAGLDMRVLAHDKYAPIDSSAFPHVRSASLDDILREADIISLHLPLRAETRHYADAAFFARCRPGALLINTSRGACVDTAALLAALASGQLGGACLDVFENEKPGTYTPEEQALYARLHAMPNVLLTPHVAGWTQESKARLSAVILEKLAQRLGHS